MGPPPPASSTLVGFLLAIADREPRLRGSGLRSEVERHRARTMTVVSLAGVEQITRCGTCEHEPRYPCADLRRLAEPYADHAGYRSEWAVAAPS